MVWLADPDGVTRGWGDLELYPDDMAKIGWMIEGRGLFRGERIVSEDWMVKSETAAVQADATDDYGYGWWLPRQPAGLVLANGRGGQHIAIWREKKAVMVMLAGGVDLGVVAPSLIAALGDAPLPENPDATARLQSANDQATAAPEPVAAPSPPAIAESIRGKRYALGANSLGLSALSLDFPKSDEASLTLSRAGETWTMAVGLDGVPRFSDNRLGLPAALTGRWNGDSFELSYDEVALINHFRLELAFSGGELSVKLEELSSSLFPAETFTGTPE